MQRLLINRITLRFKHTQPIFLVVRVNNDFVLNKNTDHWIREGLSESAKEEFNAWLEDNNIEEKMLLATEYKQQLSPDDLEHGSFSIELDVDNCKRFQKDIFKQELGRHLQEKGCFIQPKKTGVDFSAFQFIGQFNGEYDQYRRVDFSWNRKRDELTFNFGSEKTLVTRNSIELEDGEIAFDVEKKLVYKSVGSIESKTYCPREKWYKLVGAPKKFNYKDRYEKLKEFSAANIYDFDSQYFWLEKTGLKNVEPSDFQSVFHQQNLMMFGNDKKAINAVIGMREYGPLKKVENPEKKRLLFIYQNRNDANTLYRYLKNGCKHFPGLLSYTGIPVALAEPEKGLLYKNVEALPQDIQGFLNEHYSGDLYKDTLAIVIGPFKRYESDESESNIYYQVKKLLLDKGIASQFVSPDTLNSSGVHYSLPNIAIAILAKAGGIPWKLSKKNTNELIIGFNTKNVGEDRFLGSAVFFDNEGRLGGIKGLPLGDQTAIIEHLKLSITEYTNNVGVPDRMVIHYYKPPRKDEIRDIHKLLENMALAIPIAVVEVNDSKSKLDICFDGDFNMGMPESGVYVRTGFDEYLLFNNNRYIKNPPRKIDDELPIKLKLSYVNTGGFNVHELIAQVYEFSRLNWKGLKQRSVPVTTTYSKAIAEFSSYFDGEIPENQVAQNIPWFI